MPRRVRLTLPGVPLHRIQRRNNRQPCFYGPDDYRLYLDWLEDHARRQGCRVNAFVLMTNHVHLLMTADEAGAPGRMMKALGQRYVQYVNRTYRLTGTLWEGRFRSCPVQTSNYLLACQRYIELNLVRASMVDQPVEYRWSSYACHSHGVTDTLLTPHPLSFFTRPPISQSTPLSLPAFQPMIRLAQEPCSRAFRTAAPRN